MSRQGTMALFLSQLALLVKVGVPIHRALEISGRVGDLAFRQAVEDVADQVAAGKSLSEALDTHPARFDPFLVRSVEVGEQSGSLVAVLDQLGKFLDQNCRLQAHIVRALAYPGLLLVTSGAMMAYLLFGMLPHFLQATRSAGLGPPHPFTSFVVTWLANPSVAVWAALIGLACVQGVLLMRRLPQGRQYIERGLLRVPGLGPWLRLRFWATFCRNLALLLAAGLDLVRSLSLLASASGLGGVHPARRVVEGLTGGDTLARSLSGAGAPLMVVQLVLVGEATGRLAAMLNAFANLAEQDLTVRLEAMLALVEPLLLAGMGLVVAVVVLAAMLPIIQLIQV